MVEPLTDAEIDDANVEDLGIIEIPDDEGGEAVSFAEDPPPRGDYVIPDEPPAHAKRKRGRPRADAAPTPATTRKIRVTAGIRADINAKISMPLEISGQIWAARDPLCGGVFLAQRPALAESLTDIICDSADLVAWFTGPLGGFMKYLNVGAALWPVVEVVAAHHVYHSVELAPDGAESNATGTAPQYAA